MSISTSALKNQASELGFVLCGVTACAEPGRLQQFHAWIDAGFAGQMHYLSDRRAAYADPNSILNGCRSIVMLALPYGASDSGGSQQVSDNPRTQVLNQPCSQTVRVATYATGQLDYHDVIHGKLKQLKSWLEARHPTAKVRGIVDTAPLLEREFGELAGLGWVGKNTLLLNRRWGSYFFLAALLTDLPLDLDPPTEKGYCGTCTACLQACPTQAFPRPFVLDATRCISYLTIEHRDHIASELASGLGDWLFGCDVCQEVCPWNRKTPQVAEAALAGQEELQRMDPRLILRMTDDEFRQRFRKTPLWRSRRRGIVRNALLCIGNQRMDAALDDVIPLLRDTEPLIRAASAWAMGRLQGDGWRNAIEQALATELDSAVQAAMARALSS